MTVILYTLQIHAELDKYFTCPQSIELILLWSPLWNLGNYNCGKRLKVSGIEIPSNIINSFNHNPVRKKLLE